MKIFLPAHWWPGRRLPLLGIQYLIEVAVHKQLIDAFPFELVLSDAAERAYPVVRKVLERRTWVDPVIRIALFRAVLIAAHSALVPGLLTVHLDTPPSRSPVCGTGSILLYSAARYRPRTACSPSVQPAANTG